MIKREPLMTEEHFDNLIKYKQRSIDEITCVLQTNPQQYVNMDIAFLDLFMDYRDISFTKYSKGYDVAAIKNDGANASKWFLTYQQYPDRDTFYFDIIDHYEDLLQSYCLGMLFGADHALLSDLLSVNKIEGKDALFDTLAKFVQPDRTIGTKLLFPVAYQPLLDVVQSINPAEQIAGMQKFLKGWYKGMRKVYWHDHHKSDGKWGYTGYWCLEAALVTVLYNIDDSSYRDMPFYPKDMVAYAKSNK